MSGKNKHLGQLIVLLFSCLIIQQTIVAEVDDLSSSPPLVAKKIQLKKAVPTPAPSPSRAVVAIVDNRYLTKEALERKIAQFLPKTRESKDDEDYKRQKRFYEGKMAEEWINIALLAVEAEAQGIQVTEREVEQNIEHLYQQYGPDIDLASALWKLGTTAKEFKEEIHDAMLGDKLLRKYIRDKYGDKELREFYQSNLLNFYRPEMVHVSQVFRPFIDTTETEKKKLKKEMELIRKRLTKGESFEELAQPQEGLLQKKSGDLGWLTRENLLRPPLNREIFKIKPGEISEVYESDIGYHIIMVKERKPASFLSFEEAQDQLEELLFDQVKGELIQELKPKHNIIINLSGIEDTVVRKHLPDLKTE